MNITVIGAQFPGLVTATLLSAHGHCVNCIDQDRELISSLKRGCLPYDEPGLEELFNLATSIGTLAFSSRMNSIANSDVVICDSIKPVSVVQWSANLKKGAVVLIFGDVVQNSNQELADAMVQQFGRFIDVATVSQFFGPSTAVDDWFELEELTIGVRNMRAGCVVRQMFETTTRRMNLECKFDLQIPEIVEKQHYRATAIPNLAKAKLLSGYSNSLELALA